MCTGTASAISGMSAKGLFHHNRTMESCHGLTYQILVVFSVLHAVVLCPVFLLVAVLVVVVASVVVVVASVVGGVVVNVVVDVVAQKFSPILTPDILGSFDLLCSGNLRYAPFTWLVDAV
ncbi:unnamed protein product [Polarella glacialis]|uniref:Uncharacterized protein n=1 Tax=Polarella glacialis TaxID=89957 RepID=A0A813IAC0_POLGL|nr:unnamed protein product [Polarella glacialis]CAE8649457.1 unnamed protein product [Polarella glacialis]